MKAVKVIGGVGALLLLGWLLWIGSQPTLDLTGKWIAFRDIEGGADPAMNKSLSKVEVQIFANRTFYLFERGLPKKGRVHYTSDRAVLEITDLAGRELARQPESVRADYGPIDLVPQKDGTLLYKDTMIAEPTLFLKPYKN